MSQQHPPPQPPSWQPPGHQHDSGRGRRVAIIVASILALVAVVAGVFVAYAVLSSDSDTTTTPRPAQVPSSPAAPGGTGSPTPPPGQPSPTPDPQQTLTRNDLYRAAQLRSVGCAQNSQVALDSLGGVRAYYDSVLPCLTRAWRQLGEDGIDIGAPKVKTFSGQVSTPCGGGILYSFYCPANETIYMYADEMFDPWNQYAGDDFSHGITRLAAVHTIAHEFGHHIQHVTGISGAMGDSWSGTEIERRSELQASCLGNVFLSSQRDAYAVDSVYWDPEWERLWRFITRVPNHGSEANQRTWTNQGYESARPGACNTWTAGAAAVR